MFLSGCPILEELYISIVPFDSDESLTCIEWKNFCLSNLTRAAIHCISTYFPLKAVNNTPSLRLELNQVNYHGLIPTFHNLTQLELIFIEYSCQFLVEVLNHCPKLQKLDLCQDEIWNRKKDRENWVDPDVVPQCLSLHLRSCNIFNFYGLQDELMLASYMLKSASILQTMKIWCPVPISLLISFYHAIARFSDPLAE
ncbi:probable FBD-associated F-box protein At1g32375 [Vicia villosa]|uniref:probable FBD-associated F-box protein At1g32375 n=1 Tax=Vicia villosa TaxID=3911 RepID=UPI00273B3522|nr:probable FBD-associated F-box protein At1g32375 [Vicia villosa]